MSTYLGYLAEHEPDPVDEERMCGMQAPTLDELHAERLDREDRLTDLSPASGRHFWMTPAPTLDRWSPVTPGQPVSSRVGKAGDSNPTGGHA